MSSIDLYNRQRVNYNVDWARYVVSHMFPDHWFYRNTICAPGDERLAGSFEKCLNCCHFNQDHSGDQLTIPALVWNCRARCESVYKPPIRYYPYQIKENPILNK
jgi:hypothetical protein